MTQCGTDDATEGGTGRCSWCAALHVLGLETVVSDDEIRSTYRLLAQVWHPDRFQTNQKLRDAAEEKLKEINRAYQYLTSPKGRSERCSGGSRRTPPEQAATASSPPQPASEPREPERQSQPAAPPQSRVWLVAHSGILLQYGVILVCASLAGLLVLKRLDSYLDSNPQTSKYYGETKARVAAEA